MSRPMAAILCGLSMLASTVRADDLLYGYEGDVLPYDESAGWLKGGSCEASCSESLEDGHFVLTWEDSGEAVGYHLWIAQAPEQPPASLWVEWRFRSAQAISPYFYTCDAWFTTDYRDIHDLVFMFGDAVVSFSGDDAVFGLDMSQLHTYRFESLDGTAYTYAVDGFTFSSGVGDSPNGAHYLDFGGEGGCELDLLPGRNEWDFVRYGAISYGEQIIAADPPAGYVNATSHPALDRFAVTFDEPNYVYLDEILVEVTGGIAPQVLQTRRREGDEPNTVEIVLDRPTPHGRTTRFTFNDGVATNIVEYTYAPGDTDGDGDVNLADAAVFQRCFGTTPLSGACLALDFDHDGDIDLSDYLEFASELWRPKP